MDIKYIGMDVHKEAIAIAVMNGDGKLVMESILETKAITILQFIQGLRGDLHVTFEEGTWAAWLYDLLTELILSLVSAVWSGGWMSENISGVPAGRSVFSLDIPCYRTN